VITEIQEPLDLIPKTPADDISKPNDFSEEEEFDSDSEDMEGNNGHGEEREVPLQDNQPWLAGDDVVIPGRVHNLPRHLKRCSPSMILKLQVCPKITSRNSYLRSGL
jgi:hypothetical protein